MKARIALLLLFAVTTHAAAQSFHKCVQGGKTIYMDGPCDTPQPGDGIIRKCVDSRGDITYQNEACPVGHRESKTRSFVPDAPLTAQQKEAARLRAQRARAESAYLSRMAGTDGYPRPRPQGTRITASSGGSACEDMKRRRDAYLESEQGRHTGYDGRRAWNDRVYDACK